MKIYTEKETAKFKEKRNAKTSLDKLKRKGHWAFNERIQRWIHSVTKKQGIFNQGNKTMRILAS